MNLTPYSFEDVKMIHEQKVEELLHEQTLRAQVRETKSPLFERVAVILNTLFTRQTEIKTQPMVAIAPSRVCSDRRTCAC